MVGRAEVFGWILEGLHLCMRRRGYVGQLWAREEGRRQSSVEPDLGDGAVSRGSSPSEMAVVGEDSGDHGGTLGLLLALLRGGSRRLEAARGGSRRLTLSSQPIGSSSSSTLVASMLAKSQCGTRASVCSVAISAAQASRLAVSGAQCHRGCSGLVTSASAEGEES